MEIEEWLTWITRTAKHLLWGARAEIINEGVQEGIVAAVDKRSDRHATRRSRFRKIMAALGAILGICLLGILGSPFLIEQISGPEQAKSFEHQEAVGIFWLGLIFVLLLSPAAFHEVISNFQSQTSWSTRLFDGYLLVGYILIMLSLLRSAYNGAWGSEAAQVGDLHLAMTIISSFFVVGPVLDFFMYNRVPSWRLFLTAGLSVTAGSGAVLLFGWLAWQHIIQGEF